MDQIITYLRTYFDQWPSLDCEGCHACCGVTRMTQQELEAILALLAKKGYKEAPMGKGIEYCEYLDKDGKCVVYEERPILCRVHGKMDSKHTVCEYKDNIDKAIVPQPPELLDYIENNTLFPNITGARIYKKYWIA